MKNTGTLQINKEINKEINKRNTKIEIYNVYNLILRLYFF